MCLRSLRIPIRGLVLGTDIKIEGDRYESVARSHTIVMPRRNGIEAHRVRDFLKPHKAAMRAPEYKIRVTSPLKNLWREMPLFGCGRLPRWDAA